VRAALTISFVCFTFAWSSPTTAEPRDSLFYFGQDYGSESQFNPATALLNGGFDILRSYAYQNSLLHVDYKIGAQNVINNITYPLDNLGAAGYVNVAAHEILPFRGLGTEYGQFVPNLFMHTFGEGMLYRKLEEWYEVHDVPYPRVASILTTTAVQFLNETVENGAFRGSNPDPIADMLLYNILGFILFSQDGVAGFFADQVRIDYWPGQAVVQPDSLRLVNMGENFAFKFKGLPWGVKLFGYIGNEGLGGLSIPVTRQDNFSFAYGLRVLRMSAIINRNGDRLMVPSPGNDEWDLALFWDRQESLMASLELGTVRDYSALLNIYPGVIEWKGWTFGLYAKASHQDGVAAGLTLRRSPLGLGWGVGNGRENATFH